MDRSCGALRTFADADHTDVTAAAALGVIAAVFGPLVVRRLVASLAGESDLISSLLQALRAPPPTLARENPPSESATVDPEGNLANPAATAAAAAAQPTQPQLKLPPGISFLSRLVPAWLSTRVSGLEPESVACFLHDDFVWISLCPLGFTDDLCHFVGRWHSPRTHPLDWRRYPADKCCTGKRACHWPGRSQYDDRKQRVLKAGPAWKRHGDRLASTVSTSTNACTCLAGGSSCTAWNM